jgi:hypothetical protein
VTTEIQGVYSPEELPQVKQMIREGEYEKFFRVKFWLECAEFDKEEGYGVGLLFYLCSHPKRFAQGKHGYSSLEEALEGLRLYLVD